MNPGPSSPRARGCFALLLSLLIAACLLAPAQADNQAQRTYVIAGSGWIGDAPTRIADALGYFNSDQPPANPRPIRVSQYNSGKQALEALLRNEVDFALAAPEPVAIALLSPETEPGDPQQDLVILASLALSNLSHHVVANARQGISLPEDLAGKRIGLVKDSSAHHAWHQFARFHALPDESITLLDLPIDRLGDLLRAGNIDAAVIWDPWTQAIQQSLGPDARVFSTRELHTIDWFLVSRRSTAARHPDITDRVLNAYLQAIDLIYRDPAQAEQVHTRAAARTDLRLGSTDPGMVWRVSLGWSVLANLEAQFQWLRERTDYQTTRIPPPARYLDGAPLLRVAPERVVLPAYFHTRGDVGIPSP